MEVGGCVQVLLGIFFGKSTTLLKVVSYYYLSVLSMSVMGFQKKVWMGWVGGVSSIQVYFGFFESP